MQGEGAKAQLVALAHRVEPVGPQQSACGRIDEQTAQRPALTACHVERLPVAGEDRQSALCVFPHGDSV